MSDINHITLADAATFIRKALASALLASLSFAVAAQDYPSKSVRLVVPVPPGGPTDGLARTLTEKLGDMWRQPIIVDNKPGAQSVIGTDLVAKAAPDGYTVLLLVDSTLTMLPFRKQKLSYEPSQLTPVMTLADSSFLLVGSSTLKAESLAEFVRLAKTKPGQLNVAVGTFVGQVIATRFSNAAGIRVSLVNYKGAAEVTKAIIGQEVDMALTAYLGIQPYVGTGKFNILAITGSARNPAIPNVPTLKELGYPDFENSIWVGLAVPTGTPDRIIKKIHEDVSKVMAMPDVQTRIAALGWVPLPGNPASTAELIRVQSEKWKPLVPTLSFD